MEQPFHISDINDFLLTINTIEKRKRSIIAVDLFIFNEQFPFQDLQSVVVGRNLVDSCVLQLAHRRQMPIADFSALVSIHQGYNSSAEKRPLLHTYDYYYNSIIMKEYRKDDIILTSTHCLFCSLYQGNYER